MVAWMYWENQYLPTPVNAPFLLLQEDWPVSMALVIQSNPRPLTTQRKVCMEIWIHSGSPSIHCSEPWMLVSACQYASLVDPVTHEWKGWEKSESKTGVTWGQWPRNRIPAMPSESCYCYTISICNESEEDAIDCKASAPQGRIQIKEEVMERQ